MPTHGLLYIVSFKPDVPSELGLSEEPYVLSHVSHQSLQVTFLLVTFYTPHIHAAHLEWQMIAHHQWRLYCIRVLLLDSVLLMVSISALR